MPAGKVGIDITTIAFIDISCYLCIRVFICKTGLNPRKDSTINLTEFDCFTAHI